MLLIILEVADDSPLKLEDPSAPEPVLSRGCSAVGARSFELIQSKVMKRRDLLAGIAASAVSGSEPLVAEAAAGAPNNFLEIRTYKLHNSFEEQFSHVSDFLRSAYQPVVAHAGAKLIGAFNSYIGPDAPCLIAITQYSSLGSMQDVLAKLAANQQYQTQLASLGGESGFPYLRIESSLLRCFDGMPEASLADPNDKRPARLFEFRVYESHTLATLARKVKMFNDGEIGIFQKVGMRPVFFGETLVGPRQPNLMYMLSFDDLAAREKLWHDFGSDPDWKKLSSQPGLSDAQIVSNISNVILRPLSFSLIR
jgi:hypothetical protein